MLQNKVSWFSNISLLIFSDVNENTLKLQTINVVNTKLKNEICKIDNEKQFNAVMQS